jgi:hypothetical protein
VWRLLEEGLYQVVQDKLFEMEEEEKQEQEQDQSLLLEGGQQVEEGEPEPPQVRRFLISLLFAPVCLSVSDSYFCHQSMADMDS